MNQENWKIIEDLFDRVVEFDKDEQLAWLDSHCSDPEIKSEVIELLRADRVTADPTANIRRAIAALATDGPPTDSVDLAGQTIGAYQLLEQIGVGGMGTVYLAERSDGAFDQHVAIKLLNPAVMTAHSRQRFLAERQMLAGLDHPNIARLLDGGESQQGLPYLVLDYVEGDRIDQYCSAENLSIKERCRLFVSVCDAVQYAHTHLIVHRDLKPSNVLVSPQGVPKLLDFGIAKLLEGGQHENLTMTAHGQPMTPLYASPEQRLGQTVTTVSDVYSLGLLFYLLLAGELPGQLHDATGLSATKQVTEPPSMFQGTHEDGNIEQRRQSRRKELRGDLDNIVMMALRSEPERRYASVAALADDVRRYLRREPVAARADSWSYRAVKFSQRHYRSIMLAVLVLVMMVFHTHQLSIERDRSALEAEKANRVSAFLVNIFETANPSNMDGSTLTAVELLDQAVESISSELAQDPETRGDLLMVMAQSYRELYQFDKALRVAGESVAAVRQVNPVSGRTLARSLIHLGVVQRMMGDYDAALVSMLEAEDLIDLLESESDELYSWALNTFGLLYKEMGQFDLAVQYLQASVQLSIDTLGENHSETADAMNNFAITVQQMGDYRLGTEYACRAAEIGEKTLPRLHSNLAVFINNCGRGLRMMGRFEQALDRLTDSHSRRVELMGEHSYKTLFSYMALADLYRVTGQFDQSRVSIENARLAIQGSLPEDTPEWGRYYRALGKLQFDQRDYDQALLSFNKAYQVDELALGTDHLITRLTLLMKVRALIKTGNSQVADPLLVEAGIDLDKQFDDANMIKYSLQLARAELSLLQQNTPAAERHYKMALNSCEINIGMDAWCSKEPRAALAGMRP